MPGSYGTLVNPLTDPSFSLIINISDLHFPAFSLFGQQEYERKEQNKGFSNCEASIQQLRFSQNGPQSLRPSVLTSKLSAPNIDPPQYSIFLPPNFPAITSFE